MALIRGPNIVTNGLVLYLDAGNRKSFISGSNRNSWFDLISTSVTGSLKNGTSFNFNNLGAMVFDGVNDYVNCGSTAAQVGSFTINGWAKRNGTQSGPNNVGVFVSRSETVPNYKQNYQLSIIAANKAMFNTSVDSYKSITGSVVIADNTWYDITGTFDSTTKTMKIYVNGTFQGSTTITANPPTDSNQLFTVGCSDGTVPGNYFKGSVASIKLYNRTLTDAEVFQNYNATKTRFGL